MAVTEAEVCNLALLKVGETQLIDTLLADAKTTVGKACRALFATSRDVVLEERPWPFATRRADLALVADGTVSTTDPQLRKGWTYSYILPADCLPGGARYLWAGIRNPAPEQMVPFELEDDATEGPILVTDQAAAHLIYTRRVTEVVKMTPLFQEALAWKLAYELCFAIPVKSALALQMAQGYAMALDHAAASAFKHMTPSPKPRPAAIRAR